MKLQRTKLGFTLIELMVVITIIGILATGAVSVYTSQIQKARDSNRVTSLKALQSSVEQAYSDVSEYPDVLDGTVASWVSDCAAWESTYNISCVIVFWYMPELPVDSKSGSSWNGAALDYMYNVADDTSWVTNQLFEVSTWFEADWSIASKASNGVDKWNDANRFEAWNSLTIVTSTNGNTATSNGTIADSTANAVTTWNSCQSAAWTNVDGTAVIIKWNCGS